jgi:Asp-tRNA(Asn)/Glu-tRNA(Gln) amidotransferase A subunit family amidase
VELHELGLLDLCAAISSGEADGVEAVALSLDRIDASGSLNAIVEARPQARDEARGARGPLPMNLGGVPSLSLPCGKVDGLGVNVSLTAAKGRDATVLSLGEALEAAFDGEFAHRIAGV